MKRLYISLFMVLFSIIVGIIEVITINYSTDFCLENIEKIEYTIESDKKEDAVKLCENTAEEFETFSSDVIYCYYPHDTLENISQNLWVMVENLKNNDTRKYKSTKEKTKKQLLALKEQELFNIQNIL